MVERMEMRAGDSDRQHVADQLRVALEEGRLELHEYDERLQRAYAAKTYGDLNGLLADLPNASPTATPMANQIANPGLKSGPKANPTGEWLGQVWGSWLAVVSITTAVWGVASLAAGGLLYFWPIWVAMPWGFFLVIATVGGLSTGGPQKMVADRERKALAKEHRRERRALQARAIERGELPAKPTKEERRAFVAEAVTRGELAPKRGKT